MTFHGTADPAGPSTIPPGHITNRGLITDTTDTAPATITTKKATGASGISLSFRTTDPIIAGIGHIPTRTATTVTDTMAADAD